MKTQVVEAGNQTHNTGGQFGSGVRPKGTYDPTDNKGRGYRYLWAIYPSYWNPKWGQKPLLGHVRADSEFDARYVAFDKNLCPRNDTFEPEAFRVQEFKRKPTQTPYFNQGKK